MRLDLMALTALPLLLMMAPAIPAAAPVPDDPAGLVCRWDFDGSLVDPAGQTRDAFAPREGRVRFVDATEVPGVSGRALAVGVRTDDVQYLVAAPSDDIRLGANYTLETWLQPTGLAVWNRVLLRWGGAPHYAYHLAIHQGLASLYHGQASGEYLAAEGGRLAAGQWYHLVGVARREEGAAVASTLTVYLNGRAVGAAPFDGTIQAAADEGLGLGDSAGSPAAGTRFRGYVDEVTIWNRALLADEIAARYALRADLLRTLEQERRRQELAQRSAAFARLAGAGCTEIVFAERGPGRDMAGHYYANFGYACTDPSRWFHSADGGSLCQLDLRTGALTRLVDDPGGAVRDPQVHADGRRILFSYRPGNDHYYHLYEINTDGSGLRQITAGEWDDIEPAYLPDDDLVFCSSRAKRYIGCWLAPSATLHRCDSAGRQIRVLSSGAFTENTPAVLPDGRVLYTRWEYVNRDPVSFHHLWTMNPDGTGAMVYFGNLHPGGVFIDAQPLPNGPGVVLIDSPGHGRNEHAGRVARLAVTAGPDAQAALQRITAEAEFRDPYPLTDDLFLVARENELLLLDAGGTTALLYTASGTLVHEPRPVRPRPRPALVPTRRDEAQATGTLVLADVYRGRSMAGVPRGAIKRLLVLEDLPKPANFHGGGSQPIGHGVTSTLKRVLGTVPVEPDGSAQFVVPALRSLYFAALDEQERSIKQMRSFVTVQPGETVSCVGCHDSRHETPPSAATGLQALTRPASPIAAFPEVPAVLDFPRDIQPILDRHCVRCHNHERRDGGVTLTGDRGPVFSHSYYTLLLHWQIKDTRGDPANGSGRQPGHDPPFTTYSSASPLMAKLDRRHYDVHLTPLELRTVRLWIDSGAVYAGTYAAYGTGQVGGCWNVNEPIRVMADAWPSTPPAQAAVERRCAACHGRWLPRHVTDRVPSLSHEDMLSWERPLSRYSRHHVFNLSRPEKSLVLLVPLARAAGGYAEGALPAAGDQRLVPEDRRRPPPPAVHPVVFADTSDPDYGAMLAHLVAAGAALDEIKRFDMPGFRPNEHYVRELKRFGVLPAAFDPARDPLDVYASDEAYWRSLWHQPAVR